MKKRFVKTLCAVLSCLTIAASAPAMSLQAAEGTEAVASVVTMEAPEETEKTAAEVIETEAAEETKNESVDEIKNEENGEMEAQLADEAEAQSAIAPWEAMKNYVKGDIVSYKGSYYECLQPHQSLEGWEPDNVPALWTVYETDIPDPDPTPDPEPEPGDIPVTGIELNQTSLSIEIGKTAELKAVVLPDDATNKNVAWSSSNSSIASVSEGVITAVSSGTAVITAAAGGKEASCTVTVKEPAPQPMPDDSPLPGRVLTGYWQNFDNGATCLRLSDVPKEYNVICISFAEATQTPGGITFVLDSKLSQALGGYTVDDFKADVITAHNKGQKVILSIGGEVGNVIINSPDAAKNFADSAHALMQEYGFDGIDIDLEHGIDVNNLADALHQLAAKAGSGFILTMAPQTMDIYTYDATYLKLARACSDILTIMNTQYYNSGGMPGYGGANYNQGTIGFLTALATTQLESGLRPDQVGLGLPATTRAAGGGYQDPANVAAALESLVYGTEANGFTPPKAYNNIRGAMTWSINWDATNNYKFAKTVAECFAKLPPIETGNN